MAPDQHAQVAPGYQAFTDDPVARRGIGAVEYLRWYRAYGPHMNKSIESGSEIEHRMFSFITMNWRGRPLRSYEVVVNLIGNTTNRGGLIVEAQLDRRRYPTGRKVSEKEVRALRVERDTFHGDWNYVIHSRAEVR